MSEATWSFAEFVRWLQGQGSTLERAGTTIEFDLQEGVRPSVRLRAEHGLTVGELTVWDDGAAHMAVVDLRSGEFIFERDGVSLAGLPGAVGLREFFEYLT